MIFFWKRFYRQQNFHRIWGKSWWNTPIFQRKEKRRETESDLFQTTSYHMIKKESVPFLKDSEKIWIVLHRHWIVFVFKIFYILFLIVSSWIILLMKDGIIQIFGGALFWWCMSLYWILFLTFIFLSWINDELDLFIITSERVIGIDQVSALSRKVTECGIDRVQEVNAETSGILQTIFWYWHVHIHTASEHSDMIVYYAPNPIENARKINSFIHQYRVRPQNEVL